MDARVRGHEVDDQITAPANRVRRSRRRPIAARRLLQAGEDALEAQRVGRGRRGTEWGGHWASF